MIHFIKRFTQVDYTQINCSLFPPLMKRSTTWRTVYIAWLQPIPFLKPNCLLSALMWRLSKR